MAILTAMPQAKIPANIGQVTLEYETMGRATDPAVLLIMGLTVWWKERKRSSLTRGAGKGREAEPGGQTL